MLYSWKRTISAPWPAATRVNSRMRPRLYASSPSRCSNCAAANRRSRNQAPMASGRLRGGGGRLGRAGAVRALDGLDRAHHIDHAVSLEVALAAERDGAVEEDFLDLLGLLDELAADRQEG